MVKFFSFSSFLLLPMIVLGQNIVPNTSFEEYSECPSAISQIERVSFWKSWSGSPDYFNVCSPSDSTSNSYIDVPSNGFGYQMPASGDAYIGIYGCGFLDGDNFREIIACNLLSDMAVGQTYHVSFKMNLSVGGYFDFAWACNNMGILFTTEDYDWLINPFVPTNFAHVHESSIVTDTLNWVTVSGTVIADLPYSYMAIGNFYTDEFTDTLHFADVGSLGAYYFIDDVCVSTDPNCGTTEFEFNDSDFFKIYPNPVDEILHISSINDRCIIRILTLEGRIVFSEFVRANKSINTSSLCDGVYIIEISDEKSYRREKLVINHVGG